MLEGGNLDPDGHHHQSGSDGFGGNGTIQAGFIVDEGVVQAGGTKPSQRLLIVDGTVVGGGTLTVNGTVQPSGPVGVLNKCVRNAGADRSGLKCADYDVHR